MASLIDICNRALSSLAVGSIADFSDASIEARECGKFAPALLSEVSSWHDWGWQIATVALPSVDNDRPYEWTYAYAVPSDMEQPLLVRMPALDPAATVIPDGMWVDVADDFRPVLGDFSFPMQDAHPIAFIIEGATLYCNVENALLRYRPVVTDASVMPARLARAFELELAARLCLPLRKDAQFAQMLKQQAEIERQRAIADDENKHPRPPVKWTSAAAFARAGLSG